MAITEKVIRNVPQYHTDPETGEVDYSKTPKLVDEVEVKATGKDTYALKDAFKESAWRHQNQTQARRRKYGVLKLTDPHGRVGEVFGHEEEKYRKLGWGQHSTRPTFLGGFGEKEPYQGFRRTKYKYVDGNLVEYYREEK